MAATELKNYRDYFHEVFQERRSRNPSYSMRAFARDLNLSPSRLNDVLKGRYGISPAAAPEISSRLNLSAAEAGLFCNLVKAKHSRLKKERSQALQSLQQTKRTLKEKQLDSDQFKVIAEWYHLAILELLNLKDFSHTVAAFADKLNVPEAVIQDALDRLLRLGLLKKTLGSLKAQQDYTLINVNLVPSRFVRMFHSQILGKAVDSVEKQKPETRLLNTLVLAVEKDKMARAQELINEFKKKFNSEMGVSQEADDVYALSIQYFSLTDKEQK